MAQTSTLATLDRAKRTLKDLSEQIAASETHRRKRLAAGDSIADISAIDAKLQNLRASADIERDRAKILEGQLQLEHDNARLADRAEKVKVIEQEFAARDEAAKRASQAITEFNSAFRDLYVISRRLRAANRWNNADLSAVMIGGDNIVQAIQSELYRIGGVPILGGGAPPPADGPTLPAAKAPTFQTINEPSKIEPLEIAVARASKLASEILRSGRSTGSADTQPHSSSGRTLSELLQRQIELAAADQNDPQVESEYAAVISEIADLAA